MLVQGVDGDKAQPLSLEELILPLWGNRGSDDEVIVWGHTGLKSRALLLLLRTGSKQDRLALSFLHLHPRTRCSSSWTIRTLPGL